MNAEQFTPIEQRYTTVHDRFAVSVTFHNGDQTAEPDMNNSIGEQARERASKLSIRIEEYKTVEVFDRMARCGAVQLWVYANGFLIRTEERK